MGQLFPPFCLNVIKFYIHPQPVSPISCVRESIIFDEKPTQAICPKWSLSSILGFADVEAVDAGGAMPLARIVVRAMVTYAWNSWSFSSATESTMRPWSMVGLPDCRELGAVGCTVIGKQCVIHPRIWWCVLHGKSKGILKTEEENDGNGNSLMCVRKDSKLLRIEGRRGLIKCDRT